MSKSLIFTLMFFILLTAVLLLPAMAGWGALLQKAFGAFSEGFGGRVFSGFFAVSVLFQLLAFFVPLTVEAEIAVVLAGLAAFFFLRIYDELYGWLKQNWLKLSAIAVHVVAAGSFYPFILDHFGYYVPSIQWLRTFGLTRGLANLDLIYAQMSPWHILQAGFSHISDAYFRINTLLLLAFSWYVVEKKTWSLLLLFPVLLLFVQSPSPDLAALVLSLVVLQEIFSGNRNTALLFAFSVWVFAIKPTMVWLPLFSGLYFFRGKNLLKFILGLAVFCLYLFKNIWLFGYPFFPVAAGDLGLEWASNGAVLQQSSEIALMKTYDMQYTYREILQFTPWERILRWFTLPSFKSIIHVAFVLVLMVLAGLLFFRKEKPFKVLIVALLLKSLLVVAFSAQYRFFLDVFFVLFFILSWGRKIKLGAFAGFGVGTVAVLLLLGFPRLVQQQVPTFRLGHYMQGFTASQCATPAYFRLYDFRSLTVGNLELQIPDYELSFDAPQPSVSVHTLRQFERSGVIPQWRGEKPSEGLVWREMNASEKEKLKKFILSLDKKH